MQGGFEAENGLDAVLTRPCHQIPADIPLGIGSQEVAGRHEQQQLAHRLVAAVEIGDMLHDAGGMLRVVKSDVQIINGAISGGAGSLSSEM